VLHGLLLDDPLQVLTDPAAWVGSWLAKAAVGSVQGHDWPGQLFSDALSFTGLDAPADCTGAGGTCTYFAIWSTLKASGFLVLALALTFRLLTVLFDPRKQVGVAQWLVADVLVRGSLAVLAIDVSYPVLAFLMHASIDIGGGLYGDIVSIGLASFSGPGGLARALTALLANEPPIPMLLEVLVILYLTVLVVASRVAVLFAIAVAPLLIPLWAFSGQSTLFVWWLRLVAQGLLVPVVLGALMGVALTVCLTVQSAPAGLLAPISGTVTTVAVLWFVGHAIRQLLAFLFPAHQGFVAGFVLWHDRAQAGGRLASSLSRLGR
jgi:hypothetical protein